MRVHAWVHRALLLAALARGAGFEVLLVRRYNAIPRNIFFHFSPRWRRSRGLALAVDSIDAVLAFILNPFCQNYGFVLRKPAPTRAHREQTTEADVVSGRIRHGLVSVTGTREQSRTEWD